LQAKERIEGGQRTDKGRVIRSRPPLVACERRSVTGPTAAYVLGAGDGVRRLCVHFFPALRFGAGFGAGRRLEAPWR